VHEIKEERVPLAIEDWLTVIVMALLALITFANVLVRYFTDQSFAWTEEFSVFLMIVLALVAGSAAVARNRHIRIEYFAESGSHGAAQALARFGALMVFLLFALIGVLSVRMVWDDIRFDETTPGIGVPQWWYTIWLPVLSVAIARPRAGPVHPARRQAMIATLLFVAFLAMMLVGVPIGAALGLAGAACIALANCRRAVVRPAGRAAELLCGPGQVPAAGGSDVRAGRLDLRPLRRGAAAGELRDCHRRPRPGHAAAGGHCGGDVPGRHLGLGPGQRRRGGRGDDRGHVARGLSAGLSRPAWWAPPRPPTS
jgi:TRAP-type C4-dicarboxylate transport system permease small subunit